MLTRSSFVFFLGALLLFNWPTMLLADDPVQTLKPSSTSSFLLVASRKLTSPWFREAVVLVTPSGHPGPIGIIVNRPRDLTLDKIFPGYPAARDIGVFAGGPLKMNLVYYLFRGEEGGAGALKVAEHLYFANGKSLLGELLSGAHAHTGLRVVNGLAGWGPGQLENEIARGDWYVLPTDDKAIFDLPAAEMWPELLRRAATTPRDLPEAILVPADKRNRAIA
jgi:putative transcriptional regulator